MFEVYFKTFQKILFRNFLVARISPILIQIYFKLLSSSVEFNFKNKEKRNKLKL